MSEETVLVLGCQNAAVRRLADALAARLDGVVHNAPYAGVKAMQRGMARALAREWGPHVRVNCLAPLATSPAMEAAFRGDPGMKARILGRNPLRRLGDPVAEIGATARFLLSDDASYITGHTLMVDGGSCPAT
jgi:NAD(P)-dependent dehydrogenase (short-subunit alcohol dehydrogenase family)